jgi:nucleoid-associated protein YgaU
MMLSGRAIPRALVRLYLNDSIKSETSASSDGTVSFSIDGVPPGSYRIRLEEVDRPSGEVKSRAEVTFHVPAKVAVARASAPQPIEQPEQSEVGEQAAGSVETTGHTRVLKTASVAKGESLWRISTRVYGRGIRYTEIYRANQGQIRNPNLIYPGQIFVFPIDKSPMH